MAEARLSFVQRLFTGLLPRAAADSMRAELLLWMMRCRDCGFERSVWEIGGIRWKAKGNSRTWRRCPSCGRRTGHDIYRKSGTPERTHQ